MRDAARIKEKIEVRLDSRQVVSLLLGAAVVLGVVFYLGVTVGKDLALAQQPGPGPVDVLARLDEKTVAVEDKLTFPDALTEEPAAAAAVAPAPKPEPVKPEPKPEPAKHEPALAVAPAPEPGARSPEPGARSPEPALPSAAELLAAADQRVPKPLDPSLAQAPAEPETRTDAGGAPAREPAPPTGGFTVQAGAMPDRGEADGFADKLRAKGFAPYVIAAEIPGKGTFYRVRLGKFGTRDAADRYLADFKRETGLSAFVTAAGK